MNSDMTEYEGELREYTDEELKQSWNYLEGLKLTSYVETKMDCIMAEMSRRELRK